MQKALICLLCTLLLSACGWHLRGSQTEVLTLGSVHVSAQDQYGELAAELRRQFGARGVAVPATPEEAQYQLTILDEDFQRRTAGVGVDALASAYELTWTVHYTLSDDQGQTLLSPDSRNSSTRFYDVQPGASATQEERLLRGEMSRDLARQILNRVQSATSGREEPQ